MICELVKQRINELLFETGKTLYEVRTTALIPRSTINTIMQGGNENIKLKTIMLICVGFNISLEHFFASNIFDLSKIDF